ncbi:restriction endonuclease subunit S [Candidatus Venteria ishoeyi]|uniref:Type-1 restriction enzyme EcoKI specificity protein n=1 Tax=Candidatus Venteria ishoeyi TaxID=1899563 RepID=A0A1H6FB90_9GAMM|nr:restriction endonuclease subunit S [Candidatus Venteria ishoeyi]SEH06284.1 Type-1 restriction enzyme EcoKI specificity protein [Candidatus Venteria ishoeyi]
MKKLEILKLIDDINTIKPTKHQNLRDKIKVQEWFFSFENKIPKNWLEVNFMDVTWLITCGVAKKPNYVTKGIPFLSAQNTRPFKTNLNKIKYITKEAFSKITSGGKPEINDILYTRVGNCGEAASIPYEFDFAIYVSLTLIKPIHEILCHKFLVAFLNSNFGKIQANVGAIGIGLKNLNVDNVRKYKIPLPPLLEQRAIVAKIETLFSDLDKGIADLKTAQEQLKIYRQAVLKKSL